MRQLKLHRSEFDPKMNPPQKFNYWIEDDGVAIWREYTNWDYVAVHIDMKRAVDENFEPIGDKLYPMPRTKFRSYSDIGGTADILATVDTVVVCTDGSIQPIEHIIQPGHWTHEKWRVWTHCKGTGSWRYFDTEVDAVRFMDSLKDTTEVLASCEAQSTINEDDFIGVPI